MSKRILILTDGIDPPAYAPRVVSLCRWLSDKDYLCSVFSDDIHPGKPFRDSYGEWYHTGYYLSHNNRWHYIKDKLFNAREKAFQAYIEQTVSVNRYDLIFCSSCYYFPLRTTYLLAQKYHKPYIVDLRDIAEQWGNIPFMTHTSIPFRWANKAVHRLFTAVNIRQRNRVLENAAHVVTISPWHRDLLSRYNPHTHLVYNGFDQNDFYPEDIHSDKFTISYAGKIYNLAFRDPRLMLEAVRRLLEKGDIPRDTIELVFHTDTEAISALRQLAEHYELTDICHIDGYIPKKNLLPLLHRSSVLMVLTCLSTPEGPHGIMGTKFYEALGVEKPVLCVRSDEECLAQVVTETNAGLAGTNVDEVERFILVKYREWQTRGFTRQIVNQEKKRLFTRQYQSLQLEQLFHAVIHD